MLDQIKPNLDEKVSEDDAVSWLICKVDRIEELLNIGDKGSAGEVIDAPLAPLVSL